MSRALVNKDKEKRNMSLECVTMIFNLLIAATLIVA